MAHHELLCEVLAALKHGTCLAGAYDEQIGAAFGEVITDSGHQRVLVAYHDHVDIIVGHEAVNGFEVERRKGCHVGSVGSCSAVAGSDEQLVQKRTLAHFPSECRFAAA